MCVPSVLEYLTLSIDHVEEQIVKQPEVGLVAQVQVMELFKAVEECSPSASKLTSHFNPKAFNSSIVR
jgi:hypothetical protein